MYATKRINARANKGENGKKVEEKKPTHKNGLCTHTHTQNRHKKLLIHCGPVREKD